MTMAVEDFGWSPAHNKQVLRVAGPSPGLEAGGTIKSLPLWSLSSHTGRRARNRYTNKHTELLFMMKAIENEVKKDWEGGVVHFRLDDLEKPSGEGTVEM